MKVILFGGSGMIGQGTLLECLKRSDVTQVLSVGRTPLEQKHAKLQDVLVKDLTDFSGVPAGAFENVDAVLYCLGVSSGGMSEADYRRITYDFTMAAAKAIYARSPNATFCFISGASTDSTEQKGPMWARVKGAAENALQKVGFKAVYCFRPGYIQPMDGIKSKTPSYRWMYVAISWAYPLFKGMTKYVTSTRQLGFAMVEVAKKGFSKVILESDDINLVR
ncbi:MAG: epimerase [Archangium sp.]|nr:epimerase [Archangium sp.]